MINLWNWLITAFIAWAVIADFGHSALGQYRPTFPQRLFMLTWAGLSLFAVWCR